MLNALPYLPRALFWGPSLESEGTPLSQTMVHVSSGTPCLKPKIQLHMVQEPLCSYKTTHTLFSTEPPCHSSSVSTEPPCHSSSAFFSTNRHHTGAALSFLHHISLQTLVISSLYPPPPHPPTHRVFL